MQRRTFLELAALGALHHAAPSAFAANATNAPASADPAFGSGYFGRWITDAFGLPAYHYTCDQTRDPKAVLPVNEAWRSKTDHIHQFGNDRLVVVASNYGYVQVRQDEGSPKFLNDYAPAQHRFGGGIGFLADGDFILSTHYPATAATSFERFFGTGYVRKQLQSARYEIDQTIFAPFGDDPVLVSQTTVTNRSAQHQHPRWIEYWGCTHYQFSYRALMEGGVTSSADAAPQLRRDFSRRFAASVRTRRATTPVCCSASASSAVRLKRRRSGQKCKPRFARTPTPTSVGPSPRSRPVPAWTTPPHRRPSSSRSALPPMPSPPMPKPSSATASSIPSARSHRSIATSTRPVPRRPSFSSANSTSHPEKAKRSTSSTATSRTARPLNALVAKYSTNPTTLLATSSQRWRSTGVTFSVDSEPWVAREIAWNSGYIRSALTFDSFFQEHILSQGAGYQYLAGLQGAARDPLQHVLPLIFTAPDIVRGILRYTLKEIQPDGAIPYAIVGAGVPMPCRYRPSDLQLWVLWLTTEYVLATRDNAFLSERVPTYPPTAPHGQPSTVLELLDLCFHHLTEIIGTGEHGLQRLLNGDWNDSIVVNRLTPAQVAEVTAHGESVLNAAMATWVFDNYARLLTVANRPEAATAARRKAAAQREAVQRQWNGRWFRRAWLGQELGWNGEKQLWLEPQPWALLGGCTTPEQTRTLVRSIDEMCRRRSPIGALMQYPADPTMKDEPGNGTNGGIFAAINATLIWALSQVDGAMAWDEWKKNTFALHADQLPRHVVWHLERPRRLRLRARQAPRFHLARFPRAQHALARLADLHRDQAARPRLQRARA